MRLAMRIFKAVYFQFRKVIRNNGRQSCCSRSSVLFGLEGDCPDSGGVALDTETGDHPGRHAGNIGVVPEGLAPVDVGDVDFHDGKIACRQRVPDRNGSMRVGGRVDHDPGSFGTGFMDEIDQRAFVVALVEADVQPGALTGLGAEALHVLQGLVSVDLRLARAEKVEVRAVEDIDDRSGHEGSFAPMRVMPAQISMAAVRLRAVA